MVFWGNKINNDKNNNNSFRKIKNSRKKGLWIRLMFISIPTTSAMQFGYMSSSLYLKFFKLHKYV